MHLQIKFRSLLLILSMLLISTQSWAQAPPLNISLASNLSTIGGANDCWGWWDGQGNEYAIVGLVAGGVAIVNITNPNAPVVVGTTPGPPSTWRDIKSFQNYVYVVHDFAPVQGAGLQIIDMDALPNIVYKDTIIQGNFTTHNLYIDDGYAYLCGNTTNQGINILDLNPDPWNPVQVGQYLFPYVHDIYVRDNIAYASEVEFGLTILDVSDKTNIQVIGQRPYVNSFTHNAWLNDSSTVCFTTDEVSGGFVKAWDVSDPSNIFFLDEYRSSTGAPSHQSVPHNVHVLNDFLVTSYYRDGMTVVDAAYPYNLIEIGHYDTSPLSGAGFEANWGAYPFFPSGTCIASDAPGGLFVFNVNYQRACYLEGDITDIGTGFAIPGASVSIQGQNWGTTANTTGFYATGTHVAGSYTVTYSAFGYKDSTITVTLSNGNLTVRDIPLEPLALMPTSVNVTELGSGASVPNAVLEINHINGAATYNIIADANGNANTNLFPGTYTLITGAWGWNTTETTIVIDSVGNNFSVQLPPGYQDEFALDLGWTVTSTASDGAFERGDPVGVQINQPPWPFINVQPENDWPWDIGDKCYATGLAGGNDDENDLDDGITELISPLMDLSNLQDPVIRFKRWFYNDGGQTSPNDTLTIEVSNGITTEVYRKIAIMWNSWASDSIVVSNLLTPTANMTVTFRVGDYSPGHVVEAAIDAFKVVDLGTTNTVDPIDELVELKVSPNPVHHIASISYNLGEAELTNPVFELVDLQGKVVLSTQLMEKTGSFPMNSEDLSSGVYLGLLRNKGQVVKTIRILK